MYHNAMMTLQDEPKKFLLPAMVESDFTAEDLVEDMDGISLYFNRVKIPSGGMTQFEIPTENPDEPDYAPNLEGVILHHHPACAYWPESEDDDEEDQNPLCSSVDGITGIGTPGGACAACKLNVFGTGAKGRGKACKNMHVLYLLRSGEMMPLQLNLPPTSIRPFKEFMQRAFRLRNRASFGSLVRIGLKKESTGKTDYSVATFRLVDDFRGEELKKVCAYAKSFKVQVKQMNEQRAQANADQYEDLVEEAEAGDLTVGDNLPFTINGDREELPG